jgi:N-acetyl-anhydromuramyl-L-alanine amidase AmpD
MKLKTLTPPLAHRSRDAAPTLVVLHASAGASAKSSIDHLRGVGLSYHYIIARDGKDSPRASQSDGSESIVFHCVPNAGHAFHVGSTVPPPVGAGSINRNSIGVSLANLQNGQDRYTDPQITALGELLDKLRADVPSLRFLTTHAVVQPWNRSDPLRIDGPAVAAAHGFTWWQPTAKQIKAHKPK